MAEVMTRKQAKMLKRTLLGFCGAEGYRSGRDIALVLVNIGVVEDMKTAEEFLPKIVNRCLVYSSFTGVYIDNGSSRLCQNDLLIKQYRVLAFNHDGKCSYDCGHSKGVVLDQQ